MRKVQADQRSRLVGSGLRSYDDGSHRRLGRQRRSPQAQSSIVGGTTEQSESSGKTRENSRSDSRFGSGGGFVSRFHSRAFGAGRLLHPVFRGRVGGLGRGGLPSAGENGRPRS